ncbi:response regulator transcription factor [Yersinia alsatica]|uniref:response regulator transcription factor n=1 Tax=Yersinia alsatica TaxID=2890317 RepID=UPI001643AF5C|nr:response regulator transcription factor [Yersinia alsatica]
MSNNTKVVVIDSSPLFFLGLNIILKNHHKNIELTKLFKGKIELYNHAASHQVDMVIMNFNHEDNPFKTIRDIIDIKRIMPEVKIFIYTGEENSILIKLLFDFGVNAIVSRKESPSKLTEFISYALKGEFVYSQSYIDSLIKANIKKLTDRELDVLVEVHNGLTLTHISRMFHKSIKTISNNKRNAMKKLGINSNIELLFI